MAFYKELLIEQGESGSPSDDDITMMHLEYDAHCRIAKALCSMSGHSPQEWVMLDEEFKSSSLLGSPLAFATWISDLKKEEYPRIVMRWQMYASQVKAFQEAFNAQKEWDRQAETWSA